MTHRIAPGRRGEDARARYHENRHGLNLPASHFAGRMSLFPSDLRILNNDAANDFNRSVQLLLVSRFPRPVAGPRARWNVERGNSWRALKSRVAAAAFRDVSDTAVRCRRRRRRRRTAGISLNYDATSENESLWEGNLRSRRWCHTLQN